MFEKYSALGFGGRVEPSLPYLREERKTAFYSGPAEEEKGAAVPPLVRAMVEYPLEEERVAVSPIARAMVEYPLEEERGVVSRYARAMVEYPLEEEKGVVSRYARAMVEHPLEEEKGVVSRYARAMVEYPLEEERGRVGSAMGVGVYQLGEAGRSRLEAIREFEKMRHLISKFKLIGEIEPEEMLELLGIKEYAKKWNKEEWIKEIEEMKKRYDTMKWRIIYASIFKCGDLEPEEMLELLGIKKYAKETGKKEWLKDIEEIENKYYKDVPPIPAGLKQLLRNKEEPPSKEETGKLLKDFITIVKRLKLGERSEKSFVRLLGEMSTPD